ncbi:kunitz protease inhibitor 1 [Vairimorpha apis BRL 01]|uniref:Kunitz protease inhibitor 1 n=1 Tax=Vairimorpha apis BRL 01 TaxID=1037528 RepID=T0MGC7_9MICR|nr:kunitz protease inhibitor 1 [Vairimorpha apis BRL 01]
MLLLALLLCKIVIRKEIRDMNIEEWNKYKSAFDLFKEKGYLADISKIHVEVESYAHKNGRFLPWHRMLLLHVESILQMLTKDPSISIPYWDWSIDYSDPVSSFIFGEKYWGIKECYLVSYPEEHCLKRSEVIDPFYSQKDINRLIKTKGSYDEFRDILELVPHALVHSNVGGVDGDMSTMYSPNDPIFWHHHSYIDLLWHKKQKKGLDKYDKKLDINERLYPFNKQVKDVLKLKQCKIKYKPFKIYKIQGNENKASFLPEYYIKQHEYDKDKVRKYEKFMRGENKKSRWRKIYEWLTGKHRMSD